ncbi:hypothetical protein Peur_001596 [Populus x canadensis]
MAILVDVFEGVCLCVSTLWDLQEMRFANVFDGAGHGLSCFTLDRFVCIVVARIEWCVGDELQVLVSLSGGLLSGVNPLHVPPLELVSLIVAEHVAHFAVSSPIPLPILSQPAAEGDHRLLHNVIGHAITING